MTFWAGGDATQLMLACVSEQASITSSFGANLYTKQCDTDHNVYHCSAQLSRKGGCCLLLCMHMNALWQCSISNN